MAKKIEVQIVGDASSLQRALNNATGQTSKFGSALGSLARAGVLAAGAAGLGAMFVTLRSGIKEYTESSKVAAQTNAVIKSTGGIANVTAKEVDKLATALMRKSGVDDEAIATGENMILTFKNIRNEAGAGNDIFNQATLAVLDMDTAMTQGNVTAESMAKTSIRVGKALNDPIKGVTALARVGVTFTQGQKDQIEAMVKSGDVMGAQKLILKELTSEFGGSAEAIGKTMPKQLAVLKESFNNFAGDLVAKAIPSVQRFVDWLNTNLIPAEGFTAKLKVVWEGMSEVAVDLWGQLETAVMGETRIIKIPFGKGRLEITEVEGLASKLKESLRAQFAAIDWSDVLVAVGIGIAKGVLQLQVAIWTNISRAWVAAWSLILSQARDAAGQLAGAIVSGMSNLPGAVNDRLRTVRNAIINAVVGWIPGAMAAAVQVGERIVGGVRNGLLGLVPAVIVRLIGILPAISSAAGQAYTAATRIGSQIVSGVLAGLGSLYGAVKSKIEGVLSSVLSHIDIPGVGGSTPEHGAQQMIGVPMGQGVIAGWIKSTATLPEKMAASLRMAIEYARKAIEAARDRLGSAFDGLTSRILRAFDAESQGMETTSEKRLREMDERRQMEDLVQRQTDAQLRLNEAIATGDAAAIAAAQRDLTRATEDIERVSIEAQAAEERKNLDSLREEQRIHLEKKLAALEASFAKEGASVKKAMAAMVKLMRSFGIDFETAGALVGEAFVAGLRKSLGAAARAASGVDRTVPGASGFRAPAVVAAGAGGGNVTVVFPNYVGDKNDLIETVRSGLAQLGNRGGLGIG